MLRQLFNKAAKCPYLKTARLLVSTQGRNELAQRVQFKLAGKAFEACTKLSQSSSPTRVAIGRVVMGQLTTAMMAATTKIQPQSGPTG